MTLMGVPLPARCVIVPVPVVIGKPANFDNVASLTAKDHHTGRALHSKSSPRAKPHLACPVFIGKPASFINVLINCERPTLLWAFRCDRSRGVCWNKIASDRHKCRQRPWSGSGRHPPVLSLFLKVIERHRCGTIDKKIIRPILFKVSKQSFKSCVLSRIFYLLHGQRCIFFL